MQEAYITSPKLDSVQIKVNIREGAVFTFSSIYIREKRFMDNFFK